MILQTQQESNTSKTRMLETQNHFLEQPPKSGSPVNRQSQASINNKKNKHLTLRGP